MSKVSVVLTNYNGEPYLDKLLKSLAAQTYRSMEVLIVDDVSTDRSIEIISSYLHLPNFRLIERPLNGGLPATRNTGIDESIGEYIYFVDNDDWLAPDTIQRLMAIAQEYDADVVDEESIFVYNYKGRRMLFTERPIPSQPKVLTDEEIYFYPRYSRGKLYRRSAIGDVRFIESVKVYEDFLFEHRIKSQISTYVYANASGYFYLQRPGSFVSSNSINHLYFGDAAKLVIQHYRKTNYDDLPIKAAIEKVIVGNAIVIAAAKLTKLDRPGSERKRIISRFLREIVGLTEKKKLPRSYRFTIWLLTTPVVRALPLFILRRVNMLHRHYRRLFSRNPVSPSVLKED